ncbi:hypothetical protein HPB51_023098 [Rhipicephalus microplus]|uniref:Uncharacterized protein n=1 Tax=Rhipicephalus microplus TaxID=6941 RepID=A0A9J6DJ14_RHIMP|nr:hypothetical protein HPB51_023098 [Rhipicephalus microplus]
MRSHVDVTPLRTTFMSPDEFGREENVVSCCECPIRKPVRRRSAARSVPGTSSSAAARGGFDFVCRSPRRRPKWTGLDRPPRSEDKQPKPNWNTSRVSLVLPPRRGGLVAKVSTGLYFTLSAFILDGGRKDHCEVTFFKQVLFILRTRPRQRNVAAPSNCVVLCMRTEMFFSISSVRQSMHRGPGSDRFLHSGPLYRMPPKKRARVDVLLRSDRFFFAPKGILSVQSGRPPCERAAL